MILDKRIVWGAFLLVLIAVLYALFRPTPPEMFFENSDKVGHVVAFMMLGITARFALLTLSSVSFWSILFSLAFVLEYLQGALRPLRVFSIEDVIANAVGVLLAFLLLYKAFKKPLA